MKIKNAKKGGLKGMERTGKIYSFVCQYCNKEFIALKESQAEAYLNVHQLTCKENPSVMKQNAKSH